MLSSSASRRERPVSSSSTTRVCARRLDSTHSCWKRSERVKSAIRSLITDCAPRSIAGASTSARSGRTSRASDAKSTRVKIAVSSFFATASWTAGSAAIGATVLT